MKIIYNNKLSKNNFTIYKELKDLITILTFIIRLYLLDLFTKLSLDLKIELHEDINYFSLKE